MEMDTDRDIVRRYLCDDARDTRIITTRLIESVNAMLSHQNMPIDVRKLCQEMAAAAAILANILKFEGEMILQLKGNGPINFLMAECSSKGQVRATGQWEDSIKAGSFRELVGTGHLIVTVNPTQGKRYQSMVSLNSDSIAECLNEYFKNSEQLNTRVWLSSDGSSVGGLLIQRLPSEGGYQRKHEDAWSTVAALAQTVTEAELISDAGPVLAYRLFNELHPRAFSPWPVIFECSCSKERSARALQTLGKADLELLFQEQTVINLDCHFCGQLYLYRRADLEWIMSDQLPKSERLQ